jgi:hypothetical protein
MYQNLKSVIRIGGFGTKMAFRLAAILILLTVPSAIWAESLSAAQQEVLQQEGIPQYPNSSFTTSDESEDLTVLWFKSDDSLEQIITWYSQNLTGWSVLESNGTTVLYKGSPGLDVSELSDKPYIFSRRTTESEPVFSEITVRLPKN